MLTYHLDRLSFLLDTTMLPADTRSQWAIEELIVIYRFLAHTDSRTRYAVLSHLQSLVPSHTLQRALARLACSEEPAALP